MDIEFEELSNKIIKSAIEVHKKLGPGFLELIYQKALPIQLEKDGMGVETQKEIKIYYDGEEIGTHFLDLVVEKEIVVELKAVTEFNGLKIGLLLNFAKATLEIKRVVN